jgi:hypothetical protein
LRNAANSSSLGREGIGKRYARAYAVLKADFWIHAVVDDVCIQGHTSAFLRNGGGPALTPDDHMRRTALKKGLGLLAAHFGYDRPDRRQSAPAASYGAAANGTVATSTRKPRRGLDVMFSPETEGRPDAADVAEAVDRLRSS